MIRIAPFVVSVIFIAGLFGCMTPPGPGPEPLHTGIKCKGTYKAADFVSSIKILQPNYMAGGASYSPPGDNVQNDKALSYISSQAEADLTAAFNNAPQYFQHYLCDNLEGVFVSVNTPSSGSPQEFSGSWGFRSFASNAGDKGSRYVAISSELWPNSPNSTSAAEAFHTYENSVLNYYASQYTTPNDPTIPTITQATPDDPWITVLAALAHEVGHIRWAEIVYNNPGDKHDFSKLHKCSIDGGLSHDFDFFQFWSYAKNSDGTPNDDSLEPCADSVLPAKACVLRWRQFGSQHNTAAIQVDHANSPFLADFANPSTYSNKLWFLLYQSGQPWTGVFGANSPDEDFVETYVFSTLMGANPPLTSLPVNIPLGYSPDKNGKYVDVVSNWVAGNRDGLIKKAKCIHSNDP